MGFTFVKKAVDAAPKSGLTPKYMLHKSLMKMDPARPLSNVHASALTKPGEEFCPRYYALHDVLEKAPNGEWLTAADILTFDIGNDTQDRIVNYFADIGKAIGHWECMSCKHQHLFQTRPQKCVKCSCKAFKPREVRFVSAKSGASCGVDLLLNIGEPKLIPIELKTMKKEEFAGLMAPLAEHRLRTSFYLRIIAESDHTWASMVATDYAWVLYVCKGGYVADQELATWGLKDKYSPFKQFRVTRKDEMSDTHSKKAKVVKDFREGLVGMPCGVCATPLTKRAQWCSMKTACFSGGHPAEYDWTKP